jgi:hypothetical protein
VVRIIPSDKKIAFARSSFLLYPLPPAGGEGDGEGAEKNFGNEYKIIKLKKLTLLLNPLEGSLQVRATCS